LSEQNFLVSTHELKYTLDLLEYHFDELSDQYAYISSKDEIILEQITLISQFYLLYSTMKHYNKYLEKMRLYNNI